ncbi:hypothetical protein [Faecalibacillus faecis]|uniref:hypothetical protein n=1 Tax=Faecalibacillus faecis TaxID=1982628 RepID=UPI00386DDF67
MEIINLTPHDVTVILDGNVTKTIKSSGTIARCSQTSKELGPLGDIPLVATIFGDVVGLPDPQDDVWYIVSRIVMNALPLRRDLLVPNDLVRDNDGNIIGCRSFSIN